MKETFPSIRIAGVKHKTGVGAAVAVAGMECIIIGKTSEEVEAIGVLYFGLDLKPGKMMQLAFRPNPLIDTEDTAS